MARFRFKRVQELARQLMVGPPKVRRRQADRLEELLLELHPDRDYPYEFLYFRITGFRPQQDTRESFPGGQVMPDLIRVFQALSKAAPRAAADLEEPVYTLKDLCAELNVAARTLRRWRRRGLVTAYYAFAHEGVRLGVSRRALERFMQANPGLAERSGRFSRLSAEQEREVVGAAEDLVRREGVSLTAAARRVAELVGRSPETVRLALLRHEREQPGAAFRPPPGRLTPGARRRILADYRQGVAAEVLARRHRRSPATVYRIINQQRAAEMLAQPLDYFREEAFAEPDADRLLFGEDVEDLLSRLAQGGPSGPTGEAGEPWPLTPLGQAEERALFRALNYAKSRADELRQELNPRRYVPSGVLRRIEALRGRAETLRERLVRAHLPLAAQVARQHAGAGAGFQETYARARTQLGHLVETFDYRGRARFPRYASLELMKAFARAATPQAGDDA